MTGTDPRWTLMDPRWPSLPRAAPSRRHRYHTLRQSPSEQSISAGCSSSNVYGAQQQTSLRPGILISSGRLSGVGAQKCQRRRKPACTDDNVIRSIENMAISRALSNVKQQAPASLASLGATLAAKHIAKCCFVNRLTRFRSADPDERCVGMARWSR